MLERRPHRRSLRSSRRVGEQTEDIPDLGSSALSPSFEKIVSAFDGYGECVDDPKEMMPALKRGLKAVREEKRQAVLNVICKYPV